MAGKKKNKGKGSAETNTIVSENNVKKSKESNT